MQLTVGTEATPLPVGLGQRCLVQNLGPDPIYFDFDADVTTSTGVRIGADEGYELMRSLGTGGDGLHLVSSGTADVRFAPLGT